MATSFFGPHSVGMSLVDAVQLHDRAKARARDGINATQSTGHAPPGWDDSIARMQQHKDISNPYALAWWMRRRGTNPAKHATQMDAAFDTALTQAVAIARQYPLPHEYTAAAKGENWAVSMLLDPNLPPLIVEGR